MDGNRLLTVAAAGAAAAMLARRVARARRRISFANRVVVITGGSRGLGLTIARELAREGARLALLARDDDELHEARRKLRAISEDILIAPCDVTAREQLEDAMDRVLTQFGRMDVLINTAGILQCGPLEHMTRADFEMTMNVHFWGPFHAMLAAIPVMIQQGGGRIVNIASVGGGIALPHLAPYTASKFALVGLSDALRTELRAQNIRVTTVCPGLMRTGSHVNATFKGQHEAEFAWFSIGNATPLLSVSVDRAARQIIDACRHGDAHLTIGMAARLAILGNALFPDLVGDALALVNRLLPGPGGAQGDALRSGWDSRSGWSPSLLTYRSDRAVAKNNELRGHSIAQLWGDK